MPSFSPLFYNLEPRHPSLPHFASTFSPCKHLNIFLNSPLLLTAVPQLLSITSFSFDTILVLFVVILLSFHLRLSFLLIFCSLLSTYNGFLLFLSTFFIFFFHTEYIPNPTLSYCSLLFTSLLLIILFSFLFLLLSNPPLQFFHLLITYSLSTYFSLSSSSLYYQEGRKQ